MSVLLRFRPRCALLWLACLPNAVMASFSAMLHSSAKQNSLFYFRMAGGYTRKSSCSMKAGIPGYMSKFPTRDIFSHKTGTLQGISASLFLKCNAQCLVPYRLVEGLGFWGHFTSVWSNVWLKSFYSNRVIYVWGAPVGKVVFWLTSGGQTSG